MKIITTLLQKTRPKEFFVLGLHIEKDQLKPFALVKVINKRSELHFLNQYNLDTLANTIEIVKDMPVVIQIEGPGIIHKRRDGLVISNASNLVELDCTSDSFSVFVSKLDYETAFSYVIESKLNFVDVLFGCNGLSFCLPKQDRIQTGHYVWNDVPYYSATSDEPLVFFSETTTSKAITLCMRAVSFVTNEVSSEWQMAWFLQLCQRRILYFGIPLVFLILIVNFFAYQPLYSEVYTLQGLTSNPSFKDWKLQKAETEKRDAFIARNSVKNPGILSWQVDQILKVMPVEIKLLKIENGYLVSGLKPGKPPSVRENTLIIHGKLKESGKLDHWLNNLDFIEWIQSKTITGISSEGSDISFYLEVIVTD